MSDIVCDCGTFFMNGRMYYNISGKSYEGHNPLCGQNYTKNNDDTIVVKLRGVYIQDTFLEFDIAIYTQSSNSVVIHKSDLSSFKNFCNIRGIKIESYPGM